jgi:S-formylglutathione hydrolase
VNAFTPHGALVVALRNPGHYRSVSAFSPIVAPTQVPWGQKAFAAYLGEDRDAWRSWDACELVRSLPSASGRLPLLVDQGGADEFLATQLRPELLEAACSDAGHPLVLRRHAGYDHSYYFIASFIGEHIAYHATGLRA